MKRFLFREHFGAALKAHRESAQVRPAEIAAALKRDQSTIWRWESGRNWPEDPDQAVDAYNDLAGGSPMDLWEDAARRGKTEEASLRAALRTPSPAADAAGEEELPPAPDREAARRRGRRGGRAGTG